jgi:hypothetical protein
MGMGVYKMFSVTGFFHFYQDMFKFIHVKAYINTRLLLWPSNIYGMDKYHFGFSFIDGHLDWLQPLSFIYNVPIKIHV